MATAAEPLVFNPLEPAYRADPYPTFRRFREEEPFHQSLLGPLILSRHADCLEVLRSPHASSDGRNADGFEERRAERGRVDPELYAMTPFVFLDPPDHTRLRRLVSKAFTPRVVEGLRPRIEALVAHLIEAREGGGEMEVIGDLAYPLPVAVISEMLGVPAEDHETFKGWSEALARSLDSDFLLPPEVIARSQEAGQAFVEYFRGLIDQRRRDPRDDLLSALIAAEDAGDSLTEEELLATCILLLVAGHETTVNLIGNGLHALLRHPAELARLRDDPALIRSAVEELLRYDSPVQLTGRAATADIETGSGVVAEGQLAILLLGAANRDPAQFDEPERLDIARSDNRHLAFGFGTHFCLGAPLARLEGQIALAAVSRLPGLELAEQPAYKENVVLRGLATLPVRFGP